MKCPPTYSASIVQTRTPNWRPLETTVGNLAGLFMWMHELSLAPSLKLHAYKHVTTRGYLYLSVTGTAYERRRDDSYAEISLTTALTRAFSGAALSTSGSVRHL